MMSAGTAIKQLPCQGCQRIFGSAQGLASHLTDSYRCPSSSNYHPPTAEPAKRVLQRAEASTVFSTVIACLSGFRGADRTRIWEQIVHGGGAVTTDLTSNCTHLVTSEQRGDKCRKAMDMDINIVPAMWVTRSLQNRRKEDEDSYCARKPLEALVQVATDPLLYHGQEVRAPLCVP